MRPVYENGCGAARDSAHIISTVEQILGNRIQTLAAACVVWSLAPAVGLAAAGPDLRLVDAAAAGRGFS